MNQREIETGHCERGIFRDNEFIVLGKQYLFILYIISWVL
jgi:hypothetical protein